MKKYQFVRGVAFAAALTLTAVGSSAPTASAMPQDECQDYSNWDTYATSYTILYEQWDAHAQWLFDTGQGGTPEWLEAEGLRDFYLDLADFYSRQVVMHNGC